MMKIAERKADKIISDAESKSQKAFRKSTKANGYQLSRMMNALQMIQTRYNLPDISRDMVSGGIPKKSAVDEYKDNVQNESIITNKTTFKGFGL